MRECMLRHFDEYEQHEHENADGRHRFVLAMTVRMVFVRRPLRGRDADERHYVRGCVSERMKAVGENRDRSREVPESDLCECNKEVENEDAPEDADDRPVPIVQNTCAVGIGHHRNCTLPMMYFFGTKPQWRLSELLFRWSPMTK